MSLYSEAVEAVTTIADNLQHRLDSEASAARRANIDATRDALRNLVPVDDPMRPVCELLAHSLTIGRDDDGFPDRRIGSEAQQVYAAAIRALGYSMLPEREARRGGLLDVLSLYKGAHGEPDVEVDRITEGEQEVDYKAWSAARDAHEKRVKLS